jgi:hypothetical protein
VLVANKCDLVNERKVPASKGVALANSWGKVPFYESSAKYRSNVDEVFIDLVRQIMRRDSALSTHSRFNPSFSGSLDEKLIELAPKDYLRPKGNKKLSAVASTFTLKQRPKDAKRKEKGDCTIM